MAASVYDERSKQGDTYDYEERAKERIAVECTDVSGSFLAQCANEIANAEAENYRSYQDLKAQEQTAKWAFFMTVFAAASTAITAVGIVLVRQTLHQTVEANRAAQDAIEVTRQIGRLQTQAYVSFHHTMLHFLFEGEGVTSLQVKVVLKNTGQSPAKIIYGFCDVRFVPDTSTRMDTWQWRDPIARLDIPMGSDETRWILSSPMPIEHVVRSMQGGLRLGVVGCVEYTDVFDGPPRTAEFAVVIVFSDDLGSVRRGQPFDHDWYACQNYSAQLR